MSIVIERLIVSILGYIHNNLHHGMESLDYLHTVILLWPTKIRSTNLNFLHLSTMTVSNYGCPSSKAKVLSHLVSGTQLRATFFCHQKRTENWSKGHGPSVLVGKTWRHNGWANLIFIMEPSSIDASLGASYVILYDIMYYKMDSGFSITCLLLPFT